MSSVKTSTQTTIKKSGDKVTVTKRITTTTTKPGKVKKEIHFHLNLCMSYV